MMTNDCKNPLYAELKQAQADLATWKARAEEQDKIIKAHINVNSELFNELIETEAERDKYKEDYEVSFAEWQTAVKTIEDWKDRWTKANEIYKDLLAANTVLRAALEMYAANRSPEWRLSDNGELAEQTLNGLTELQKQVKDL